MGRVVDLAMGLAFVYLLLASMVSAASEIIAWLASRRSASLRRGIVTMLQDKTLADTMYAQPLIKSLTHGKDPSYIPTRIFVAALLQALPQRGPAISETGKLEDLRAAIDALPEATRGALTSLLGQGIKDLDEAREVIGHWFDSSMDRVSGAYRRNTQAIALALALGITVGLNADSLRISESLWTEPSLRAEVVQEAAASLHPPQPAGAQAADFAQSTVRLRALADEAGGLGLPIGWASWAPPVGAWPRLRWLLGLLATVLAVSLGAPFWFDVLNRIGNIRATGPKPKNDGAR